MEAKGRRSGNPSSMALKPALEMVSSFSSNGSSGVPTETVAKEVGIELRVDGKMAIVSEKEDHELYKAEIYRLLGF